MTHFVAGTVIALVLLGGATPGWSRQQYLYAPKPVAAEEKVQNKDGILVQEVSVRKGDTLYGISRSFSGRGSYYPQILLFNEIKNPDRIYPGNVLRIPVSRSGLKDQVDNPPAQSRDSVQSPVVPVTEIPAADLQKGAAASRKPGEMKHKAHVPVRNAKIPSAAVVSLTPEQKLYERAIKAYRQDDYRTALELFDRFLVDHPSSPLAADASLYKAECYLKQSNQ